MVRFLYIRLCILGLSAFLAVFSIANAQKAVDEKNKTNSPQLKSMEEEIAQNIEDYFTTDFGDTDVSFRENEKKAFEKLVKKFNGRNLKINFPIEDVSVEQGKYVLSFRKPDFPGKLEYSYLLGTNRVKLSKKQALEITKSSILEISGKISLITKNSQVFSPAEKAIIALGRLEQRSKNKSTEKSRIIAIKWTNNSKDIELYLEKPTFKIIQATEEEIIIKE